MFSVQFRSTKRNTWKTYGKKLGVFGFLFDAPTAYQFGFQTPATEIMEKIVDLHNDIVFFLVAIVIFVS